MNIPPKIFEHYTNPLPMAQYTIHIFAFYQKQLKKRFPNSSIVIDGGR
jgi:hypothetical protein